MVVVVVEEMDALSLFGDGRDSCSGKEFSQGVVEGGVSSGNAA